LLGSGRYIFTCAMEPKTPADESRDVLARYEDGVWTFIAIVGCMLVRIIVWVAFVML
jgi:hypothetical protein